MNSSDQLLLAGDIGGTKTDLAIFDRRRWPGSPIFRQTFANHNYTSFEDLLSDFACQAHLPGRACFGVAGPVLAGRIEMTNLAWVLDSTELAERFRFQDVCLINDLVATALGATLLPQTELHDINRGNGQDSGTMAVLAPGTGLGEAFLLPVTASGYRAFPSEGGHASFAPRNVEQAELLAFLWQEREHVSVEQVCSGSGMINLYRYLRTIHQEPAWLRERLAEAEDPTPVLVQAALADKTGREPCQIAAKTISLFLDILADEAANLALKVLATRGIYLGGGMLPRLLPLLEADRFNTLFQRGVYKKILTDIPLRIILNPGTALLGAAAHGFAGTTETTAAPA